MNEIRIVQSWLPLVWCSFLPGFRILLIASQLVFDRRRSENGNARPASQRAEIGGFGGEGRQAPRSPGPAPPQPPQSNVNPLFLFSSLIVWFGVFDLIFRVFLDIRMRPERRALGFWKSIRRSTRLGTTASSRCRVISRKSPMWRRSKLSLRRSWESWVLFDLFDSWF